MESSLKLLLVEFPLDGLDLLQGDGFTGFPSQDQETQRPDLELLRIGVFDFGGGVDFTAEGAFHNGSEGRFPACGDRFGLDQEIVGQVERSFHIWVMVWFYGFQSSFVTTRS